jgi:hypothetical protein
VWTPPSADKRATRRVKEYPSGENRGEAGA